MVAGDAIHCRIETRRQRVTQDVNWLFSDRWCQDELRMPGLVNLACGTASRGDRPPATRYCLFSARLTPKRFATAVRAHWAIENSLHWAVDVTFHEDRARNRKDHAPKTPPFYASSP